MEHLVQCSANYTPLTLISFLEKELPWCMVIRVSIIYGSLKYTWKQTFQRCYKLASALKAPHWVQTSQIYELHFAVPMAGAVFSPLNIHQDSTALAAQFKPLEAKVIYSSIISSSISSLKPSRSSSKHAPISSFLSSMLETDPDAKRAADDHQFLGYKTYDSLLNVENNFGFEILRPHGEFDPISIVFTSGTTGEPKGVVPSHRGAYLTTLAEIIINEMKAMPIYLWTVPMNHCNGTYDAKFIFDAIVEYNVTNLGGATPVLSLIANANQNPLPFKVNIMSGGAPPLPQVVLKIEELGFILTHSYGMSEMLGPGTVYPWRPEYGSLSLQQQAKTKALHGLNHMLMEAVDVKDPLTMESVPFDGFTLGEVMFRGNTVTKGYYKDPENTEAAFMGGKKISTVDVEAVLFSHPAVFEAGVVGKPDKVAGETEGCDDTRSVDIIEYCREKLPGYMVQETVVFDDLPFTSTGKLKKAVLRERANALV
ncbi:putative acyl-activating enzyme 2 [Gossypium australe]|uniref:Putative acyl-activating enzyme 2 n=1 Tax=Gossypium australe TaxID=47621 RepID=A0A5B6V2N0_9ROSI|nr:putative acyl-activating enzyme 2 [Gossypium australe]